MDESLGLQRLSGEESLACVAVGCCLLPVAKQVSWGFGCPEPVGACYHLCKLGNTFAVEARDNSWEKSFYSHLNAGLLKPSPAWLTELSIQSRETSCICAFAILHPSAFESGLNKR